MHPPADPRCGVAAVLTERRAILNDPLTRQESVKTSATAARGAGDPLTVRSVWTSLPKRLLVGRPLANRQLGDTLLPKGLALPIFCSDALSSVAYATEAILVALSAGGLAFYHLAPYLSVLVAGLFVIVAASYRQTCHAYPGGGGSYIVSHRNLGRSAGLVAASALLVDYVMTVAVSVVAGSRPSPPPSRPPGRTR